MLCGISLRHIIIQEGCIGGLSRGSLWWGSVRQVLHDNWSPSYPWNCELRRFRASVKMMIDTSGMDNRSSIVDALPGKEEGAGYVSGGCKSEDGELSCGYSSFRGKRASMEDFFDVKMSKMNGKTVCLFGIFDANKSAVTQTWRSTRLCQPTRERVMGRRRVVVVEVAVSKLERILLAELSQNDIGLHAYCHGGSRAAEYLKQHLFDNLMKHPQFMEDTKLAISETYTQTDKDFLDAEKDTFRDDGSTASTAVLVGNHLYVANVGDSRTIISKAGKVIPLSEDHKPNRQDERKRIEGAGGVVMWAGTWRVGGVLAMSRAFGNRMLKQFVVAEPEIQIVGNFQDEQVINEELELLVLASDGLWDVVPNEDAISIAWAEGEPDAAAGKLTETAFTRGSADNITCIVVKFHHDKAGGPQLEVQKESDVQQDRSEEPTVCQEQSNIPELQQDQVKVPEEQHNQMKEVDPQQEHGKETDAGPELVKESEVRQEQSKEEQPRHD
ncbi:putative protein phosphatase 2C 76 [Bienertia sinuspersici]